jgi:hypothetical protein
MKSAENIDILRFLVHTPGNKGFMKKI